MIRTFDTPIHTNDQSIDRVLSAGLPVALVFIEGTPPADLTEALNRLARTHASQALLAQVQVKENPQTTQRYQVRATPAVITFKSGEIQTRAEAITVSVLEQHVRYLLGQGPKPEPPRPTGTGTGSGRPFAVTDQTFDKEVLGSPQPVLVDFWAPWCGPCRIVEPTVNKLAAEMAGKARFAKVNVDENPAIAARYGILSIPTMMVVRDGKIIDRSAGALPEPSLRSRVVPLLAA